jgi:AcrR family transcriptional regulator
MATDLNFPKVRERLTRDVILDNASQLLTERGVTGFRLKELAQRLNVTIPNLYRHFRDREEIIRASYARGHQRDTEFLCAVINARATSLTAESDLGATIGDLLPALLSASSKEQRIARFMALAHIHDGVASAGVDALINEVHGATTRLFRQAQLHGLVDATLNPEAISLILRSAVVGMVIRDFDDNLNVSDEDLLMVTLWFYESIRTK